jgi:hypothetical protein
VIEQGLRDQVLAVSAIEIDRTGTEQKTLLAA